MKRLTIAVLFSLACHALALFSLRNASFLDPSWGTENVVTKVVLVDLPASNNSATSESKSQRQDKGSDEKKIETAQEGSTTDNDEANPLIKPEELPEQNEITEAEKKEESPVQPKPDFSKRDEKEVSKPSTPSKQNKEILREKKDFTSKKETGNSSGETVEEGSEEPAKVTEPSAQTPEEPKDRIIDISNRDVSRRIKPEYPRASRLRREEGKVVIIARIREGKVAEAEIATSSGHERLDRSALEAVKKWSFNLKEEQTVRIPVVFRLTR